ncbi:MAG: hypothetical protein NC112_05835 [Oxalobacter formigenes]|nr:hypothetical protein [Oxalobacter formigenes]
MLSSTYMQVAIQVENDGFRQELVYLKNRAENILLRGNGGDGEPESLFQVFSCFCLRCCSRRVERYFLPEVRKLAGQEARQIAARDALHRLSLTLHASVGKLIYRQLSGETNYPELLEKHIREYCHTMMQMLSEEEDAVFSLARERFSNENWIYLADVFMQEESDNKWRNIASEADMPDYGQACQISGSWHGFGNGNLSGVFPYS